MKLSPTYTTLNSLKNVIKELQSIRNNDIMIAQGQFALTSVIGQLQQIQFDLKCVVDHNSVLIEDLSKVLKQSLKDQNFSQDHISGSSLEKDSRQHLEKFIEYALARQKLDLFPLISAKEDIIKQIPEALKFSQLSKQVYQRQQNLNFVIKIQHYLSQLQQKFLYYTSDKNLSLECIAERVSNLFKSVDQINNVVGKQRKTMPFPQYIKQNNQMARILSLMNQSNDGLLEEEVPKIIHPNLKNIVSNSVIQSRQRHRMVENVYKQMMGNVGYRKTQILCNFPRQIQTFTLDKKLQECLRLSKYFNRSQSSVTQQNNIETKFESVRQIEEKQSSIFMKEVVPKLLSEKQEKIFQLEQKYSNLSSQMQDQLKEVNILKQELRKAKEFSEELIERIQNQALSNEKKTKDYQTQLYQHKANEAVLSEKLLQMIDLKNKEINILIEQVEKFKNENKELLQLISVLDAKTTSAENSVEQKEQQIEFLRKQLKQKNEQIRIEELSLKNIQNLVQSQYQSFEEKEKTIKYLQQTKQSLSITVNNLLKEKSEPKLNCIEQHQSGVQTQIKGQLSQISHQEYSNQILSQQTMIASYKEKLENSALNEGELKATIQKLNAEISELQKELSIIRQVRKQSSKRQDNVPSIVYPINTSSLSNIEMISEKQNNNKEDSSEEETEMIPDLPESPKKKGFMLMKHSKSMSQPFNPEFTSQATEKQEVPQQSIQELKKTLHSKEKMLKKYEMYIYKYRTENIKYRATILELETKMRKYEVEVMELTELITSIKINGGLVDQTKEPEVQDESESSENSEVQDLIEKQIDLKIKENTLNDKIQEIIKHVMSLNAFKSQNIPKKVHSFLTQEQLQSNPHEVHSHI